MTPTTSQYSIRSLLVTMVTIGMVLAYVRVFGNDGLLLAALGLTGAVVCGGVIGWLNGRLVETLTWSLVGGALALCCVLSADGVTMFQKAYWVAVGVLGGTLAGVVRPGQWRDRITWTLALWVAFSIASILYAGFWTALFDLFLTLPVLAALTVLVEVVTRLQAKYHTALDVWAAGLVFAVIAGNYGAIIVWNLWYA